ncbi:unnamed protein product [Gongylonema pulchrum]|uniref:EGF-like domain-containing protein n=1 Tax=Gongylonema pulchrum TaxID=637853 RepID=A0A183E9G3_9BILA|nr:unnamed protein product [Gongylonema pulchrum]
MQLPVISGAQTEILQVADILKRIEAVNSTRKEGSGRKLRSLLNALKSHIVLLDARLKRNECTESPCFNGGTCIDLYDKFTCICPAHYEGETCDRRIDECTLYKGTHAGCQNNATCVQKPNGFQCVCAKGFHGTLCQLRTTACEFSLDLCGPAGHCIPAQQAEGSTEVA